MQFNNSKIKGGLNSINHQVNDQLLHLHRNTMTDICTFLHPHSKSTTYEYQ